MMPHTPETQLSFALQGPKVTSWKIGSPSAIGSHRAVRIGGTGRGAGRAAIVAGEIVRTGLGDSVDALRRAIASPGIESRGETTGATRARPCVDAGSSRVAAGRAANGIGGRAGGAATMALAVEAADPRETLHVGSAAPAGQEPARGRTRDLAGLTGCDGEQGKGRKPAELSHRRPPLLAEQRSDLLLALAVRILPAVALPAVSRRPAVAKALPADAFSKQGLGPQGRPWRRAMAQLFHVDRERARLDGSSSSRRMLAINNWMSPSWGSSGKAFSLRLAAARASAGRPAKASSR